MMTLKKTDGQTTFATHMLKLLDELVSDYADSLRNGWRAIIELRDMGTGQIDFMMDAQDAEGGGDFAVVKMKMLQRLPNLAATGFMKPTDLIELLEREKKTTAAADAAELEDTIKTLCEMEHSNQASNAMIAFLKRRNLTIYKGAMRVPYEQYHLEKMSNHVIKGEIRISFSGAQEWQDLILAGIILQGAQRYLARDWPNDHFHYDLSQLKKEPEIAMVFDLTSIKSVVN